MKCRVLVADDHEMVRYGVRAVLQARPDLEVCAEAVDGLDAIAKVRECSPHVIILDPGMPRLNGVFAARRIMWEYPQQRIVLFSAVDSEPILHTSLAAGVKGFVLKSDPINDLVDAVDSVRHDRPYFSRSAGEMVLKGYLRNQRGEARETAPKNGRTLTVRETEIAQLLAEGKCSKEVAAILGVSLKTAETHRNNLMRKLHIHSLPPLVLYTIERNIIEVPVFEPAPSNACRAAA